MSVGPVVDEMYASMSFEAGERPDWAVQERIFDQNARLVRVNDEGVFVFDPRTFRENLEAMIESGSLPSFYEREVQRQTHEFGDIAHVLSVYEMRTSRHGGLVARAVKSIQLFKRDDRWTISAMLWRREGQ
jgi:ketosteroid isomerase-like protein